ncbi:hypothetical protein [Rhodohalobacter sulfatireducens]|uniref:Uncharacterized protein n=1 Tax=Rhodohalobacter sulfatireducens TaxID=2911366 RepID=A0ABS9KDB2_9BACT|nr:hypothetical protein [Rhodohalobacter sulfatireducens]MCG2588837.1 hypothetical protein [Rhodohalobacter sulfatireducens]
MRTTKRYLQNLLPLLLILIWACETPLEISDKAEVSSLDSDLIALAKPTDGDKVGNNLSFPVIWSDGVVKPLRGTYGTPQFDGLFFTADGYDWYVQNDDLNTWQAASVNAVTEVGYESPVVVSSIDWGDNLESKAWPFGAQVRVETVLYKTLSTPMDAYTMQIEDPSVSGLAEVWGTNGVIYPSSEATVYSGTAKLVIQQLLKERDDPTLTTTWDPVLSQWTGDIGSPLFESGVWNAVDGPSGYSAEINVQGKVIYGYNWVTRRTAAGPGDYRITFVLDPNSIVTYNTDFDSNTIIVLKEEEEEEVVIQEEPDLAGGVAIIDAVNNLTYMDVRLTLKSGSGKPGGGDGNKGNGGGKPDDGGKGQKGN